MLKRVVWAVLLIALAARAWTIVYGTNVDEGVYWVEGRQIYQGFVIYRDTQFNKTPLVALVAALFFPFGQAPIYPMRAAMLGVSVLSLFVFYRLAKSLFNEKAALAGLILLALEPFSCIWAKYLHTSTWAPWFEIAIFYFLIEGLNGDRRRIYTSGLILGLYALSKQTAIFVIPPAVIGWLLLSPERSIKRFVRDGAIWAAGALTVMTPFFLFLIGTGSVSAWWFDIYTAHLIMAKAKYHDFAFRWHEWKSIIELSPLLWILPLGSLALLKGRNWKAAAFAWVWGLTVFTGNLVTTSHVWRHYFLVVMPPMALLAGAFCGKAYEWLESRQFATSKTLAWGTGGLLFILAMAGWPKNDWSYPGLTLAEERILAKHVEHYCPEPYLLNLTNPALYVWTGKQIPPAIQHGREVRIPFFMTIAGRGYMNREEMEQTVAQWRETPIGCVAVYDKFLRQIIDDPVMTPLKQWLDEDFEAPLRVGVGDSYYGWFFVFEKKRNG